MPQTECVTPHNSYSLFGEFKKLDSHNYTSLDSAKFIFKTIDEKYTFSTIQNYDNDLYSVVSNSSLDSDNTLFNTLYQIIPESRKSIIDSVHNIDDWNNLVANNEYARSYINGCGLNNTYEFTMPIKMEEANSPVGYQKTDALLAVKITTYFSFDDSGNLKNRLIDMMYISELFKYNSNINYYDYVSDGNAFLKYLEENGENFSWTCGNIYPYDGRERCQEYPQTIVIEDEVGEVVLTVDNTVEDKHNISVSGDNRVQYKVLVTNDGNASSGNNIIKTAIPKGLEVIEDTISNDGVYTTNNRTITWNIDYLDPYGEEELTYDVRVSGNNLGTYTITSSVSSDQQLDIVESDPAILKVINNPKTGQVTFIIEIVFILSLIALIYSVYRKITKNYDQV